MALTQRRPHAPGARGDSFKLTSWATTTSYSLGQPSATTLSPDDGASTSTTNSVAGTDPAPPPYSSVSRPFCPSIYLQIQAQGRPRFALPVAPKPTPIPVLSVSDPETGALDQTLYLSVRPKRNSGSSVLVRASERSTTAEEEEESSFSRTPMSATTYRFGPARYPRVRLCRRQDEDHHDDDDDDVFELAPRGLLSRSQTLRTRLGAFEWRYGTRSERAAAAATDSLLVMNRVARVSAAGAGREEVRTPVARLLRGDGLRTPGTERATAGNGGRLEVDFGALEPGGRQGGSGGGEGGVDVAGGHDMSGHVEEGVGSSESDTAQHAQPLRMCFGLVLSFVFDILLRPRDTRVNECCVLLRLV